MATGVSAPKQRTWTVLEAVRASGGYLDGKGVEQGRLDAEHLLAHVLGMGRLQLYLHFDRPLTRDELARFKPLLRRRGAREPLQYVLGSAPFRTLHLHVDRRVAIPRPETEYLIDVLLRLAGDRVFDSALDVGTGSGAIALALAGERLARSVTATDISPAALAAATACAHLRMAMWRWRWTASRSASGIDRDPPRRGVRPSHAGPQEGSGLEPDNLGRPHAAVPSPRRRPHTPQTAGRETTMTATTGATSSSSDRAIEAAATATVPASQLELGIQADILQPPAPVTRTVIAHHWGCRTAPLAGSRPCRAPP